MNSVSNKVTNGKVVRGEYKDKYFEFISFLLILPLYAKPSAHLFLKIENSVSKLAHLFLYSSSLELGYYFGVISSYL